MNVALILAGGTGSRLGESIPKQYIKVQDKMILSACMGTILSHDDIQAVWIVANNEWHKTIELEISKLPCGDKFIGFSRPGENRQLSILNGLEDIRLWVKANNYSEDNMNVLIHDGARPLLSEELITRCVKAIDGRDGVMPVLPVKDTLYMSEDGKSISGLLDRGKIFAGQAPELYRLDKYYSACVALLPGKILSINGSTEPAVLAGLDVAMVEGDEMNFKITTKQDLERYKEILSKEG